MPANHATLRHKIFSFRTKRRGLRGRPISRECSWCWQGVPAPSSLDRPMPLHHGHSIDDRISAIPGLEKLKLDRETNTLPCYLRVLIRFDKFPFKYFLIYIYNNRRKFFLQRYNASYYLFLQQFIHYFVVNLGNIIIIMKYIANIFVQVAQMSFIKMVRNNRDKKKVSMR